MYSHICTVYRNGEILTDTGRLLSRLQLLSMRRIDYDIYQPNYTACEENKTTVITFLHFNLAFSFNTNTPDQILNRLRLQLKKVGSDRLRDQFFFYKFVFYTFIFYTFVFNKLI